MFIAQRGSVFRNRAISNHLSGSTMAVSSPNWLWTSQIASPKRLFNASRTALLMPSPWGSLLGIERARSETEPLGADQLFRARHRIGPRLHDRGRTVAALNLVLQQEETVEDGLRPRRTAGHVDVAGDDFV